MGPTLAVGIPISHADDANVMHNGRLVGTHATKDVTKDEVLSMIILGGASGEAEEDKALESLHSKEQPA